MFSRKLRAATEGGRPSDLGAVPPLANERPGASAPVRTAHCAELCTPSAGMAPSDRGLSASPAQRGHCLAAARSGGTGRGHLPSIRSRSEVRCGGSRDGQLPGLSLMQASKPVLLFDLPGNAVRAVHGSGTCAASAEAAFASPAMPASAVRCSCASVRILPSRAGSAGGGTERDTDGLRGLTGRSGRDRRWSVLRRCCTSWCLQIKATCNCFLAP